MNNWWWSLHLHKKTLAWSVNHGREREKCMIITRARLVTTRSSYPGRANKCPLDMTEPLSPTCQYPSPAASWRSIKGKKKHGVVPLMWWYQPSYSLKSVSSQSFRERNVHAFGPALWKEAFSKGSWTWWYRLEFSWNFFVLYRISEVITVCRSARSEDWCCGCAKYDP